MMAFRIASHNAHNNTTVNITVKAESRSILSSHSFILSSFFPPVCTPSRHMTTSSSSISGTGSSTTSLSRQGSCSSEPIPSSACPRSVKCGRRLVSRAALMRAISETMATESAVRVTVWKPQIFKMLCPVHVQELLHFTVCVSCCSSPRVGIYYTSPSTRLIPVHFNINILIVSRALIPVSRWKHYPTV